MKQSIINQCLQGDRRAYKELYNETLPYIIYLCRRYHIKDDVLEDMLQEIYSDMFVALGKYDPNKAPFIQWFRKIGLNRIFKSFRTHNFETVSIEPLTLKLADSINEVDEVEESIIQKLVDQLPIGYKTIFNLSTDGYDHEEISDVFIDVMGENYFTTSFGLSLMVRARVDYLIVPSTSIYLSGGYKQAVKNWYKDDSFLVKPSVLNLDIGLSRRF